MPTEQIVALLIAEREKLNQAIEALQGPLKRRGRPPKNALIAPTSEPTQPAKKKRRKFTAQQRAAASERMRKRWAAKRKAEAEAKSQPKTGRKKTSKAA